MIDTVVRMRARISNRLRGAITAGRGPRAPARRATVSLA